MNILVAEDQSISALFLRRLLERMGHDVTVATDGVEAWRIVQEGRFPVVISDWVMPGLDGLELCRKIREREGQPYSYLILLTSKQGQSERLEGLRAGADDFLVKPPDAEELAVRLEIARRILSVQEELERRNVLLAEMALSDELTGVKNRRSFREALDLHDTIARRQGLPLSLVILDVDHFKQYNDTFGHPAGDEVLRMVASTLRDNVRMHDEVARIGGEEFAILLPDTDAPQSMVLAERLRASLSDRDWPLRTVTASLGVTTISPTADSPAALVEEADRALYRSKKQGRNQVTHFHSDFETESPIVD